MLARAANKAKDMEIKCAKEAKDFYDYSHHRCEYFEGNVATCNTRVNDKFISDMMKCY